MEVKANGISYFVERHQAKSRLPYLLLLHGFMGSGKSFEHLVQPLKKLCNPVTIDLLGHGRTSGAESPARFSVDKQIADLRTVIDSVFDLPPFLHGYSMGGRLALRFAIQHPQTIRGLILESTNYGLAQEEEINQRKETDEKRALEIENDFALFLTKWHNMPLFQREISLPKEQLNSYHSIQNEQDPKQMAHSLRGFGTAQMPSVKEELKTLSKPILILAGEADSKYRKIAKSMHDEISGSKLSIIPNAGHRIHLEQPEAFTSEIKSFITKH